MEGGKNMKQIEAFVDSVYQNVGGNKKEIQELKAEMKSHLLEAVHELKTEGNQNKKQLKLRLNVLAEKKKCVPSLGSYLKHKKHLQNGCFI